MTSYVVVSSTEKSVTVVNQPTTAITVIEPSAKTIIIADSAARGPQGPAGAPGLGANDAYAQANAAYAQANAAYTAANSASSGGEAYNQANSAYSQANTARTTANDAYAAANTADTIAKNAYAAANNAGSNDIVLASYSQANTARNQANTARDTANGAYGQANGVYDQANIAYNQANTARDTANSAYAAANAKLNLTGGTINGALTVSGNLTVTGNTVYQNVTTYIIDDPLLYVAANNDLSDIVDIGFIAGKNTGGTYSHTGLARDAGDGTWYLFDNLIDEGHQNNVIDFANTTLALLRANIAANSVLLGGNVVATQANLNFAYAAANSANNNAEEAYDQATYARNQANTARTTANDAYGQANTARDTANGAYTQANGAYTQANGSYTHANIIYAQANTARDQANTARTTANDAYAGANTANTNALNAYSQANTARDTANSAYAAANSAGGTAKITANSGSQVSTANINFVNTSTVTVSVVSGDNGNANISFTSVGGGSTIAAPNTAILFANAAGSANGTNNFIFNVATNRLGLGTNNPNSNMVVIGNAWVTTNLTVSTNITTATINVTTANLTAVVTPNLTATNANVTSATIATGNITVGNVSGNLFVGGSITTGGSYGDISNANALFANAVVVNGTSTGVNTIFAGVSATILPNTIASFTANANAYTQVTLQNRNTGTDATADYIITADNGSDTVNYVDLGIIGSGYDANTPTNSLGTIVRPADGYLYAQGNTSNVNQSGGNLAIGTTVAGKVIKLFAGGANSENIIATISNTGINVANGSITMPNRVAFRVYGANTTGSLTTTQNGDGTLTANNFAIDFEQGSSLNVSSGIFTAPVAGLYQVNIVGRNSGYTSGISQLIAYKNASAVAMIEWAANSSMNHVGASTIVKLAVNDTLKIKVGAGEVTFDGNDSWSVAFLG